MAKNVGGLLHSHVVYATFCTYVQGKEPRTKGKFWEFGNGTREQRQGDKVIWKGAITAPVCTTVITLVRVQSTYIPQSGAGCRSMGVVSRWLWCRMCRDRAIPKTTCAAHVIITLRHFSEIFHNVQGLDHRQPNVLPICLLTTTPILPHFPHFPDFPLSSFLSGKLSGKMTLTLNVYSLALLQQGSNQQHNNPQFCQAFQQRKSCSTKLSNFLGGKEVFNCPAPFSICHHPVSTATEKYGSASAQFEGPHRDV